MNTARHPHTGAGCRPAHVIPLHRGFAPRLFALDLQFASGARFVGTVEAISRDQAEEIAANKLHESVDTLLGGSSRPMPLHGSFVDTQPGGIPDDVVHTAIARADAALQRSEAVPGDDLSTTGAGTSGVDFDDYNARHGVIGRLTGHHCDTASDADEATFAAWMDRANRISAWQLYRQAHDAAWARRGEAPAVAPGSALHDMATVLRHSRSAADDAGPATWPDVWLPSWTAQLRPRDRAFLAAAVVLWMGGR